MLAAPLRTLAHFAARRPILGLALGLGCCLLASLGILRVHIETDIASLLPSGHPTLDRFHLIQEHFGASDLLAFAVSIPSPEAANATRDIIADVAADLRTWTWRAPGGQAPEAMITNIQGVPDPRLDQARLDLLFANTWLFLDEADSERLLRSLDPRRLPRALQSPSASIPAAWQDRDPLGIWTRIYREWWQDKMQDQLPLSQEGDDLLSRDGRYQVLLCRAAHPAADPAFTAALAPHLLGLRQQVEAAHPQHSFDILGPYGIVARDYQQAKDGAWLTLVTSLGGIMLLFAIAYRSFRLPALIVAALVPAAAAALGLSGLILGGSLSMVVTAFAAILIGLGVDFIIHLYNGYLWALDSRSGQRAPATSRGRRRLRAVAACRAMQHVGHGIVAAAATTIGTFLVLLTSHYRGLAELGAVCGIGLAITLLQLFVVVPAFLTLFGPLRMRPTRLMAPLSRALLARPGLWGGAMVVALLVSGGYLASLDEPVLYDRNPRHLRPEGDAILQRQLQVGQELGLLTGGHQLLIEGPDAEAVLGAAKTFLASLEDLLQPTPVITAAPLPGTALAAGGSIARLPIEPLPPEAVLLGRTVLESPIGRLRSSAVQPDALLDLQGDAELPVAPDTLPTGSRLQLLPLVQRLAHPLTWFASPAEQRAQMRRLAEALDWQGLEAAIASLPEPVRQQRQPFLNDLAAMRQRIEADRPLLPGDLADSPLAELISVSWYEDNDRVLLRLPLNLNHRTGQPGFDQVLQALGLDPDGEWTQLGPEVRIGTGGAPSIAHVLQEILVGDFGRLAFLALLVTSLLLALSLRRVGSVLVALGTLAAGILLGLAAMRLLGLQWNMMNIAVVPLVIGIGVDNGIHFLHALQRHGRHADGVRRALTETGHPILITSLTSMIGFGALMLNAYRGVQSIGSTAVVGIAACLVVALIALPVAALLLPQRRREDRGTDHLARHSALDD